MGIILSRLLCKLEIKQLTVPSPGANMGYALNKCFAEVTAIILQVSCYSDEPKGASVYWPNAVYFFTAGWESAVETQLSV